MTERECLFWIRGCLETGGLHQSEYKKILEVVEKVLAQQKKVIYRNSSPLDCPPHKDSYHGLDYT